MTFILCILVIVAVFFIAALFSAIAGNYIKKVKPRVYAVIAVPFVVAGFFFMSDYDFFMNYHCYSNLATTFWIVSLILFVFCIVSYFNRVEDKTKEQDRIEEAQKQKEQQKVESQFKSDVEKLSKENGAIIKQFDFGTKNIDDCILVFAETWKIWIFGKVCNFNEFIGCSIKDDLQIEKSSVTYKTKTSTSSMLGRAIVGGVLTGGIGALVGGATAKKKTVVVPSGNDKTIHDFTVVINTNDLSCPIIYVKCGADELLANELHGIINAIVSKNIHK